MHIGLAIALVSSLAAPSHVAAGQSFKVPSAGHAKVSYYLSHDARRSDDDVRLAGPRKSKVFVPPAPAGTYRLLACSGTHCTAARGEVAVGAGTPTRLIAFSDSPRPDDTDQYIASNHGLTPAICPAPVAPQRLPSLAGALDAAEKLLATAAGPKGMAQFKASSAYRSAAAAETAAVEAVAVKEPGAALAALLRAHDLEPGEPRYLVGAAAILTSLDHPAEALALVAGAERMPPSRSAPFGINVQALALNAEGEALLALGRFDDAERYLRAALAIEPLLAEAKQNLAIALMCRQKPDALRFLRAGLSRDATIAPDGSVSAPPIEDQVDLSQGQHAALPTVPIPGTFMEMKGAAPFYTGYWAAVEARQQALRDRDGELYKANFGNPSLLSRQRTLGLIQFAFFTPQRMQAQQDWGKALDNVQGKILRKIDDMRRAARDWSSAAGSACTSAKDYQACYQRVYNDNCMQPAQTAHQQVVDYIREFEKAERAYTDATYPWETAVLANISNPLVQEHWLIAAKTEVEHSLATMALPIGTWLNWARLEFCGQTPPDYTAPTDPTTLPTPEPCPKEVRGIKLSWKLEAVSLEVNCEKVSVEASANVEGWFGVFGQLDWSPRSGKMTVFAGPKVSAKIPGTSIGGSFKDGLYMQFGRDGSLGDVGFRTSVSGAAGFGPFAIKGGESMDFSFAPVFAMWH